MMTGKHHGLPPKVPPLDHQNRHFGEESLQGGGAGGQQPEHHPSTMVPPAFNPVFWLLQSGGGGGGGGASSSEQAPGGGANGQIEENHGGQQRFGFPAARQHRHVMPEIEMRLGPIAPSSSTSPPLGHDFGGGFHGGNGFMQQQQDRGDLSSITANLHKAPSTLQLRAGANSSEQLDSSSRALIHWEAAGGSHHHNSSEPSSSSTSNNTEMAPQFHESGASHLQWVNADAGSVLPREDQRYEPSPEHDQGAGTDCDTVMKWCDLLPTQDQSPASTGERISQGLHHQQQMQMGWPQLQVQSGGQDHHNLYEPMSQELQRMAAVLDQI